MNVKKAKKRDVNLFVPWLLHTEWPPSCLPRAAPDYVPPKYLAYSDHLKSIIFCIIMPNGPPHHLERSQENFLTPNCVLPVKNSEGIKFLITVLLLTISEWAHAATAEYHQLYALNSRHVLSQFSCLNLWLRYWVCLLLKAEKEDLFGRSANLF